MGLEVPFNDMSIRFKMGLMVFIPALVIFSLLSIRTFSSYNDLQELDKIEQATMVALLVHTSQVLMSM